MLLLDADWFQLDGVRSQFRNFVDVTIDLIQQRSVFVGVKAAFYTSPYVVEELLSKFFVYGAVFCDPRRLNGSVGGDAT